MAEERSSVMITIQKIKKITGIDRAILFTLIARGWRFLAGPIGLYIIIIRFSKVEQGFYYTLNSLLSLQIFFELGLLTVISQFASHEFAHLTWGKRGEVLGETESKDRFTDLLFRSNIWFLIASIILITVLIPAGLIFLGQSHTKVDFAWKLPWILAVLSVGGNLLIVPFYAVITGSGKVASINFLELLGGVGGTLLSWVIMYFNGGLYAAGAIGFGNILVGVVYLAIKKPKLLSVGLMRFRQRREGQVKRISWGDEIWPMQWRIAISWVAGYFVFQLFTPALFYYKGPIIAGQMGMTLTIVNAMLGISASWMQTKSPTFGKQIALKQWKELNSLFFVTLKQSLMVIGLGSLAIIFSVYFLQHRYSIGARFLPVSNVVLLLGAVCCNVAISGFAVYMRAFKTEPMLKISVIWGLATGISTILFAQYSSFLVCLGYLVISLGYAQPATYFKWKTFRKLHSVESPFPESG
jgi:hypothetical protein